MPNAHLGHHRDRNRLDDFFDLGGIGHACDAPLGADIGWDAFEGHDGHGAGVFSDFGLVGGSDVHNHAPLEHLCQARL